MFYLTFSKRKTFVILLLVNLCLFAFIVLTAFKDRGVRLNNPTLRIKYLEEQGYRIDTNFSEEIKVMTLPTEFSDVYKNYNQLQKQNGFDLEKYKGFEVTRYTLKVFDENNRNDLYCHIYLHNGYLIGGDVATTAIDGYMKGLKNAS